MELDLKRPRSGIFINETPRSVGSTIPFDTYNPRQLQEKLEREGRTKYTLFSDGNRVYFPWKQGQDDIFNISKYQANALRQDCINFNPVIFPIPDDLHKTFKAQVVFSNEVLPPYSGDNGPQRPKEVGCLFAAYVESFSKNPDYWSAKTIDLIIKSGVALCEKSKATGYENPNADFDILPELTDKSATIEMKLHLTGGLKNEPNILKALTVFFNKFHAGVLCSTSLYLLIWKRCANTFYVFDPNGRDVSCQRDFNHGKAAHMVIQTVEHIVHLILNYSGIKSTSEFDLYQMQLLDFGKLSKPFQLKVVKPPSKLFAVVNRFYSIIPASSGLSHMPDEDNISLMISYLTLVYSQMDPPRNWTMQLLGDLIDFGSKYGHEYMSENRIKTYNIVDLPEVVLFGNYRFLVEKKAFVLAGSIVDCRSYRASQLTRAIIDFFTEYDSGILQVDLVCFGLWQEGKIYFVFDAFKRGPAGQANVRSKGGTGCLQLHLSVDSLCRMVYMNLTAIKNNGNFFLHGIRVKAIGTFNVNNALEGNASYGTLRIKYPFDCLYLPQEEVISTDQPTTNVSFNLMQCLSELSISPCERTCSESNFFQLQKRMKYQKKLVTTQSIQSIPEKYLIPEFDDVDVIDSVVADFICDLLTSIQRKTEKKPQVCIRASKILLQSDRRHLEDLKLRLKRGEDYDNICAAFKRKPNPRRELTLEEELNMDSNFTALPDGSWAIFGNTNLDVAPESLKGILATIAAAALASKFNVSTWSGDVIEYTHEASVTLEDRFWSYNHTLDLIFRKQIPKIQLGSTTYFLKVLATETVEANNLQNALNSVFVKVNRLLFICRGLACLIVKRYNLLYMFMGCPCNVVGFRTKSSPGPMCLLRFTEINSLVRRIESACGRCGKYVIVHLEVKDITEPKPGRFVQPTASKEELIYGRELNEKERAQQRYKEKMNFIQHEIRQESKRINKFQKNKGLPKSKNGKIPTVHVPRSYTDDTMLTDEELINEGQELEEESVKSVEYKHKPRKPVDNSNVAELETEKMEVVPHLGYQLRDADCLFKIQGTTSLSERFEATLDKVKPCFFASAIALIYAILRPLSHWDARRIDKVINVANNIVKRTTNLYTTFERIIKNIEVDEFVFDAKVQAFTPPGSFGGNLEFMVNKTIRTKRYFLIQIPNETFAVYHDKYFHLFDPYPSMQITADEGDEEEEESPCPEHIPTQPEQNTASWILFANIAKMFEYIQKRATSSEWKTEYKLHNISILSYKTAPKRLQLINLLTNELNECKKRPQNANLCTHPEEIEWLDVYPNLVIWSRLNRTNAVKRVRGSAQTKDGNFDIELPDKLYSLWGSIHPLSAVFGQSRAKQHLAIDVVACCAATVYKVHEWNSQLLDSIVITGNDYYNDSVMEIDRSDYEISLEHLNIGFQMGDLNFEVHLESVCLGRLYAMDKNEMNLAAALAYFFSNYPYGIIQCMQKSIAIGKLAGEFFMFECQSHGLPLFNTGQGAAYVLRASQLQILLYCIVMTLNIPYYNADFTLHKVEVINEEMEEQEEE